MTHQNIIHEIAERLLEYFEGEGAVSYIEQTFGCIDDPSKSFVLTMQKVEGLTLHQKLTEAEQRIADLNMYIDRIEKAAETLPQVRSALDAINLALRDGE